MHDPSRVRVSGPLEVLALPPSVQEVLRELVSAAKDGLLALSVGVGLGVLAEMMQAEVCSRRRRPACRSRRPRRRSCRHRSPTCRRPGPPPAFQARSSAWPSSASSRRTCPKVNARRNVPSVDGADSQPPNQKSRRVRDTRRVEHGVCVTA